MGHSIQTIGNHNFPYQNLNELGRQFAQRYNLNLQVGYALQYPTDLNQTAFEASFDFVLFDEIEIPGAQRSARLYDEHYQARH